MGGWERAKGASQEITELALYSVDSLYVQMYALSHSILHRVRAPTPFAHSITSTSSPSKALCRVRGFRERSCRRSTTILTAIDASPIGQVDVFSYRRLRGERRGRGSSPCDLDNSCESLSSLELHLPAHRRRQTQSHAVHMLHFTKCCH